MVRNEKKRDRRGEFLFIDARELGYMKDRVLRDFTNDDIAKVADTFHQWRQGEGYEDIAGFCKSVNLDNIKKHDFVLTPGRYVGAKEQEDDGEPFNEKMARLTAQLSEQFAESERLEAEIKRNLGGLKYGSNWPKVRLGDYCIKIGSGATPKGGKSLFR